MECQKRKLPVIEESLGEVPLPTKMLCNIDCLATKAGNKKRRTPLLGTLITMNRAVICGCFTSDLKDFCSHWLSFDLVSVTPSFIVRISSRYSQKCQC